MLTKYYPEALALFPPLPVTAEYLTQRAYRRAMRNKTSQVRSSMRRLRAADQSEIPRRAQSPRHEEYARRNRRKANPQPEMQKQRDKYAPGADHSKASTNELLAKITDVIEAENMIMDRTGLTREAIHSLYRTAKEICNAASQLTVAANAQYEREQEVDIQSMRFGLDEEEPNEQENKDDATNEGTNKE